jgi:transcriptional regulator with GAF, ATPase, and Fis domain
MQPPRKRPPRREEDDDDTSDSDESKDQTDTLPAVPAPKKVQPSDRANAVTHRLERTDLEKRRSSRPGDGQRIKALPPAKETPPPQHPADLLRELSETADMRTEAGDETASLPAAAPPAPLPRPRPSVRGLTQPETDSQALKREIQTRVRSTPRAAAPPSDRARLLRLLEINKAINEEMDLKVLLDMIMDAAIALSNARRGFLVVWDKGEAKIVRARNIEKVAIDSPEAAISRHLIREAVDRRETVVTAEASIERGGYASTTGLDLKSVMVSPLLSRGRVIGAIYLDDPDKVGVFQNDDVRTVEAFCDQAAIALTNAYKLEEMHERYESQRFRLKRIELEVKKKDQEEVRRFGSLVGASPVMRKIFELLNRVAESSFPIVIQGESGTGKELVAKAIHYSGPRKDAPFVATNCAAVPETLLDSELFGYVAGAFTGAVRDRKGLFEQADTGTLFLDEIEEMSPGMQGKLLRVLQEGEVRRVGAKVTRRVDVRVLAATNRDIRGMVERGEFRRDLYYRLNVIPIVIPPLRERREDIPHIIADILAKLDGAATDGPPLQVEKEALDTMLKYPWPGNVRELENELKRAVALGVRRLKLSDLAPRILSPTLPAPGKQVEMSSSNAGDLPTLNLRQIERVAIEKAIEEAGGNKTQAAKVLGLSRRGLLKKLERYKIASGEGEESSSTEEPIEEDGKVSDEGEI